MYINQNDMIIIGEGASSSRTTAAEQGRPVDAGPFLRQEGRHPPRQRILTLRLEQISRIREELGFTGHAAASPEDAEAGAAQEESLWPNWLTRHFPSPWTMTRPDRQK